MKMPKLVVVSSIAFIIIQIAHAALSQLYEVGVWRIIVPFLSLLVALLPIFFLLGRKWVYDYLKWFVIVTIIFNVIFSLVNFESTHYGKFASVMLVFYGIELLVSIILLYSLSQKEVKNLYINS